MAPREPHVPGALGKYPRPNQVASKSEMCGLGPRVECAVLVSVDAVIALRVSQQVDQSKVLMSLSRGELDGRVISEEDWRAANRCYTHRESGKLCHEVSVRPRRGRANRE